LPRRCPCRQLRLPADARRCLLFASDCYHARVGAVNMVVGWGCVPLLVLCVGRVCLWFCSVGYWPLLRVAAGCPGGQLKPGPASTGARYRGDWSRCRQPQSVWLWHRPRHLDGRASVVAAVVARLQQAVALANRVKVFVGCVCRCCCCCWVVVLCAIANECVCAEVL